MTITERTCIGISHTQKVNEKETEQSNEKKDLTWNNTSFSKDTETAGPLILCSILLENNNN